MVQIQLLEQFLAFADFGTLSEAAQHLHLSQPSLTRNMKQLEDELGTALFHRSRNKLTLTKTGEFTVTQARKLVKQHQTFLNKVQDYSQLSVQHIGGISGPGAEWHFLSHKPKFNYQLVLLSTQELFPVLQEEHFDFIITEKTSEHPGFISQELFKEQLHLSLPASHPLTAKEEISEKDLAGLSMLLWADLGVWQDYVEGLTKTKFILQNNWESFEELIAISDIPHFSTNLTQPHTDKDRNRVHLPITDPKATKTFYITVLDKNRHLLQLV
ncbi:MULTISPECIES: LysR family transcriptional regulator [unclassified Streptococcus]|uniref:LysR family transcriptional regulator n=1 Tax=unclassified Streptococcus TaxID=2608887 RepID=UPI0018AC38A0|nr:MULTISPECIES: LysR family transcriptional regulator [unclassified Streptococcus]MBF8970014.1 LysR family transcriptional regulator [Streptococcus sp. NLN76]MBG9367303.1 LysR family transcriptional regulator [Streptococcus sp. NLN64]